MKPILHFLFSCLALSACNNVVDSMLYPYSSPEDFQYYKQNYQLDDAESLKTKSFYFTRGVGVSGDYYLYLQFFNDGGVYYFGGTSMEPDTIIVHDFMNVKRKRNGIPKDRKASWGYYQCHKNKLKFTIKDYGAMSSKLLKYTGQVKGDTLLLKLFEYNSLDSTFHFINKETFYYKRQNSRF